MSKNDLRLSIVIPTQNRAETLYWTLKTVVEQSYDNLQIIVSDNCSIDNTFEIVNSFDDKRILYTKTPKMVSMSSNWENGLSVVDGDYVFFLGDDDGIVPNACNDVSSFLISNPTSAFVWNKPNYNWPNSIFPNEFFAELEDTILEIPSNLLLRAIAEGQTSYGRLPILYSGFISTNIINKIKSNTGKFFISVTPDVYSGIAIASQIKHYVYSMRPMSINGGSIHSNGQSISRNDGKYEKFFNDIDIPINREIPVIPGSISSCIAESFLQAQENGLTCNLRLNKKKYLKLIKNEVLSIQNIEIRNSSISKLNKILKSPISQLIAKTNSKINKKNKLLSQKTMFLDSNLFEIKNIYDACNLTFKIYGPFTPSNVTKIRFIDILVDRLVRIISKIFEKYKLPI
jgi:glycosyltransferase involved in cell wall biosynthesis